MWPFSGTKGNPRSAKRLTELEERVETLERKNRIGALEYSELYDKVRHALGRMAKRSAIVEKANEEEGAPDGLTQGSPEAPFSDGLEGLTPRQRTIQQQILAGRMRRQ